jgi:L-threonylcarbamoyladenylate synthase
MTAHMISEAVAILRAGGLVGMPTETVYGLAADASNPQALQKIFAAKQRPSDHPLIVHVANLAQISEWADHVSMAASLLAEHFWPGPMTLIFKKAPHIHDLVTGGQATVGLRIPSHPLALQLLTAFKGGLAAPSANRFGRISPTTAAAVFEELGDQVSLILDGGQCAVGVESTIIDVSGSEPLILRPGMISKLQIEQVLGAKLKASVSPSIRVSGSHTSHYAPNTRTRVLAAAELTTNVSEHAAILSFKRIEQAGMHNVVMPASPQRYAHMLYDLLRELDRGAYSEIIIEAVPASQDWDAIRDRILRASHL